MILILLPLVVMIICIILYHKIKNIDNQECIGCVFAIALVALIIFSVVWFLIRVCDSDKFQIDAERANIVRYIEKYGDDADTNEDIYNTIYDKVYDFNYRVYRCQRTRSNPLTSWFRAGWWMEIEPIDWAP